MNILDQIVKAKQKEVREVRTRLRDLKALVKGMPPARGFRDALRAGDDVALIAEIKRASPAAGSINTALDPGKTARLYQEAGAAAISCLTDKEFFKGSLDDFRRAREAATIPLLRKDFIIDESQVWEARSVGADCILLIARILERGQLRDFSAVAAELGMDSIVEVHDARELDAAMAGSPRIVGINNRNLDTFEVRLETTAELTAHLPPTVTVIAESGIKTRQDILFVKAAGAHAALVGEEIARQADPTKKIMELLGK